MFSFSGTGERTQITSGSGGITNSDSSVEVDGIPSDLSAGDTVKVALGDASKWQGGNGELVHGEVGTIGGGANGGTDITGLSRGQEGTSASSWSEGAKVRVGVQGREEVQSIGPRHPITTPGLGGDANNHRFPPASSGTRQFSNDVTYFTPIPITKKSNVNKITFVVDTGGSTDGSFKSALFGVGYKNQPQSKLFNIAVAGDLDLSTSGQKSVSLSESIQAGLYWVGCRFSGYSTLPTLNTANDFSSVTPAFTRNRGTLIYNRQRSTLSSPDDFGNLSSFNVDKNKYTVTYIFNLQ